MSYNTSVFTALGMSGQNRDNAKTDEINGLTVDTCYAHDTGEWETAVKKESGKWVVVEHYPDGEDAAKEGHEKWCGVVEENPESDKLKDCEDITYNIL